MSGFAHLLLNFVYVDVAAQVHAMLFQSGLVQYGCDAKLSAHGYTPGGSGVCTARPKDEPIQWSIPGAPNESITISYFYYLMDELI